MVFNWVSKVISKLLWFIITSLKDWFKVLAPIFQPIRSETKTNHGLRMHIFPRFVSATCNYFDFWLVYRIVSVLFDWPKELLWFWFYDTHLKTALWVTVLYCFLIPKPFPFVLRTCFIYQAEFVFTYMVLYWPNCSLMFHLFLYAGVYSRSFASR